MLKSLMARLFGKNKPKLPKYKEEEIYVTEEEDWNAKKAFCTIRLKSGENIVSKEFIGHLVYYSEANYGFHHYITGKEVLIRFFKEQSNAPGLIQVKEDRMIRGLDIMDVTGIVESDHIIKRSVQVKKIVRTEC